MSAERIYISKCIEDKTGNVETVQVMRTTTASASIDVWHAQLGHISIESTLKMVHSGMARGMDVIGSRGDASTYCEECEASGHT